MKALFYTREYPPYVYGGAGVHVEYLAAELAKLMDVEVRCFGDQNEKSDHLSVTGFPYENPVFDHSNKKLTYRSHFIGCKNLVTFFENSRNLISPQETWRRGR